MNSKLSLTFSIKGPRHLQEDRDLSRGSLYTDPDRRLSAPSGEW